MNRRETLYRIAGFAVAAAFTGRSNAKADGLNPSSLRVGQSVALSGMSAGKGIEQQRGWLAAIQQVNRTGGVHGHALTNAKPIQHPAGFGVDRLTSILFKLGA